MASGRLLQGLARTQAVVFVLVATALGGVVSDPGEQKPVEEHEIVRVPHQAADDQVSEIADDQATDEWPSTTQRLGPIQDLFDKFKNKLEQAGSEAVNARMEVIASLRVGTPVQCKDTKEGMQELRKMLPDEMYPHVAKEVEWYKQWKTATAKHAQEKKKDHEKAAYMGAVVTHAQAQAEAPPEKFVYFVRPPDTTDCTVDGRLTAGALKQAREMREKFPQLGRAEVIIASPLARSLETALLVFQGHPAGNLSQIVLDPKLDEVGSVKVYKQGKGALFDIHREDLIPSYHLLWGESNPHEVGFRTTEDMPQLRWNRFVKSLAKRPEKFIVVFTHKAMMETNLGEVPDDGKYVMRLLRDGHLVRVLPPGWGKRSSSVTGSYLGCGSLVQRSASPLALFFGVTSQAGGQESHATVWEGQDRCVALCIASSEEPEGQVIAEPEGPEKRGTIDFGLRIETQARKR